MKFDIHIRFDLAMRPLEIDPSLYIRDEKDDVNGLISSYVDDRILGVDEGFKNMTEETLKWFDSRLRVYENFDFLGLNIETGR